MNVASLLNVWKRSWPTGALAILGILPAVLTLACGGVAKDYFYTLQAPAVPAPGNSQTPYVLGVEAFRAPEILRDDRIEYYVSPTEMNFYQHHRWGADPATLVADFTAQWLESTGIFAQVKRYPLRERVDYTLGGEVTSFEEVDADGSVKARVAVALSLVRDSDRKLVWTGEEREEMPTQGHGVDGVAGTLNTACSQALREMIPGLIAQVEQDYKSSGKR